MVQHNFVDRYEIYPDIGCLARCADMLPPPFDEWLEVAHDLPQLLRRGKVHEEISRLSEKPMEKLLKPKEARLLLRTAAFFGATWVWGVDPPATSVPRPIASVLVDLSECFGMKPLLSYATFIPWNWRLVDPLLGFEPDNISIEQEFIGTPDERWFIVIHVAIEATAARLFTAVVELHRARVKGDTQKMTELFKECARILEDVNALLLRLAHAGAVRTKGLFRTAPAIYSGLPYPPRYLRRLPGQQTAALLG